MKYSKRIVSLILVFAILSSFFVFASDVYVDSGQGWFVRSSYFFDGNNNVIGVAPNGNEVLLNTSGPVFGAHWLLNGVSQGLYIISPVSFSWSLSGGVNSGPYSSGSSSVDGRLWYRSIVSTGSYSLNSFPTVETSYSNDAIRLIVRDSGYTTDSSVVVPPAPTPDRTIYNINDSPYIFSSSYRESATPGGQTTISVLDASYPALSDGVYGIVDTEDYYSPWTTYQYSLHPSSVPSQYAVVENTSISSTGNRALHISGTYNFAFRLGDGSGSSYDYLYPQMCYLYINGNLFQLTGSFYDSSSGLYTVDSYIKTDFIGDVSLIGIVGSFNSSVSRSAFWSASRLDFYVDSVVHDNLTYTMIPDSDTTTVIPVAPTPGPEVAETFEPMAPYIPEDYSSVVSDIPDEIANQDGFFTRSIWDLIVALVTGSWAVTTGIVTNVFDGVSGIISGIVSIPQFFDYLSKDNPDGVWGINSSDYDSNLWGV